MGKIIYFTIGAVVAALLSVGLSFLGGFNFVWIVVLVFVLAQMETEAIVFAVVSGFLMDVFLHAHVGATGLSILVGLVLYVLAKSARLGSKVHEKVVLVVIVLTVAFVVDFVVRGLIGGGVVGGINIDYLVPKVFWHGLGVAIGLGALRYIEGGRGRVSAVKLK